MKKKLTIIFSIIGWLAVLTQYYLMIENRVASIGETTIRFFSFFTILTNTLVALYFTLKMTNQNSEKPYFFDKPGVLTAITIYITMVGMVYQILLRHVWEPTGLQMIVDELLHSIIPLYVILFWLLYENKSALTWNQLPTWIVYPLVYLIYILIRGALSGFYPYPFINVSDLGLQQVLLNGFFLLLLFLVFSVLYIGAGKLIAKNKKSIG